jgi:hypothetical protein
MKEKIKRFFKNKYAVVVAVFMALLLLPSLIYPIIKNGVDIDLKENRSPADFPVLGDRFGEGFDAYYNDRVPFRTNLIDLYNKIISFLTGNIKKALEGIDETVELPIEIRNNVIIGKDGWLFYAGNDSENSYLGNNVMTAEEMEVYLQILLDADAYCSGADKKFVYLTPPNREQIYGEKMPNAYKPVTEYKALDRLIDYIKAHSALAVAYPKAELISVKGAYQPVFKYDTHWNSLGAYIGYIQVLSALGMPVTALSDLSITERRQASGDLADMLMELFDDEINYDITYKPEITASVVIDNGNTLMKYTSNSGNNKTAVVIGDSFRDAMMQFCGKDFATVYNMHLAYANTPENLEIIRSADVIIFETVERAISNITILASLLEGLRAI